MTRALPSSPSLMRFLILSGWLGVVGCTSPIPSQPYQGIPIAIPGRIEMEDFDRGGEGIAYHDVDEGNRGEDYRPDEDVDLDLDGEGGFHVGWIEPEEWLLYTVDVSQGGPYRFDFRFASADGGGRFHLEREGENITGTCNLPSTGSWWDFATLHVPGIQLPEGKCVLKFVSETQGYNLDRIDVVHDDGQTMRSYSGTVIPFQDSTTGDQPTTGTPMEKHEYDRKIEFSNYTWSVKESAIRTGPGNNVFSDREEDVWVDDEGLHLTIRERDGKWWSTEVVLHNRSFGYGTYVFQTNSRVDLLDAQVVAGMFTWDNFGDAGGRWPFRELDVEFARWGDPNDLRNTQFTVQPWDGEGTSHRFAVDCSGGNTELTLIMRWKEDRAEFEAFRGHSLPPNLPIEQRVSSWSYSGPYLQPPGRENVRINLWCFLGKPPLSREPQELVVSRFAFFPPER